MTSPMDPQLMFCRIVELEHQVEMFRAERLDICPGCGGPADNGHDRCLPPSPYLCTKCEANRSKPQAAPSGEDAWKKCIKSDYDRHYIMAGTIEAQAQRIAVLEDWKALATKALATKALEEWKANAMKDLEPQATPSGEDVGIQRKIIKAGFVGIDTMIQCLDARKNTINTQSQRIAELEAELRDALAEIGVSTLSTVQTHLHERIAQLEKENQGLWSANTDMTCAISKLSRELGNPVLDGDDPLGMQVVNYALARIAELESAGDDLAAALVAALEEK